VKVLFAVWIVAGLLSLFGALTYAETGRCHARSGGEYVYLSARTDPFTVTSTAGRNSGLPRAARSQLSPRAFIRYLTAFVPALRRPCVVTPFHIATRRHAARSATTDSSWPRCHPHSWRLSNYAALRSGACCNVFVTVIKMTLIAGVIAIGISGRGDFSHFGQHLDLAPAA